MFKRKKKKTGTQIPPQYNPPPMPPVKPPKPPTSGSNAVKPNPNYVHPASAKKSCPYETPCGWCAKWDKKCDRKIGCDDEKPQRGLRVKGNFIEDSMDTRADTSRLYMSVLESAPIDPKSTVLQNKLD